MIKKLIAGLALAAGLALNLGAQLHAADAPPLRVISLHTVLTEIAREVGGTEVVVTGLVQPGVDPHTFEPSAADLRAVVGADVVLGGGLHLESYLDRLVAASGTQADVVKVGDQLPLILALTGEQTDGTVHEGLAAAGGESDPHWWHSISNVVFATDLVRAEFTRLRPAAAVALARNAQAYEQKLFALQVWVTVTIAQLPAAQRQLVTSHDAFGYFARDYGFTIHPMMGLSSDSEPDAKHIAQLIDLIRRDKIKAVFAESSVNPRLIANLATETGVRAGAVLDADGLGPVGGDAATYDSMYRHNVNAIVDALK